MDDGLNNLGGNKHHSAFNVWAISDPLANLMMLWGHGRSWEDNGLMTWTIQMRKWYKGNGDGDEDSFFCVRINPNQMIPFP